jgi:hypothetical protein
MMNQCIAPLNRFKQDFQKAEAILHRCIAVMNQYGKLELVHCNIEPIQARFSKTEGYFALVHCLHESVHKKSGKHELVHISHAPVHGLFNFFLDVPVHRFSCALVHLSVR